MISQWAKGICTAVDQAEEEFHQAQQSGVPIEWAYFMGRFRWLATALRDEVRKQAEQTDEASPICVGEARASRCGKCGQPFRYPPTDTDCTLQHCVNDRLEEEAKSEPTRESDE